MVLVFGEARRVKVLGLEFQVSSLEFKVKDVRVRLSSKEL